jgi:hypothetical protein
MTSNGATLGLDPSPEPLPDMKIVVIPGKDPMRSETLNKAINVRAVCAAIADEDLTAHASEATAEGSGN